MNLHALRIFTKVAALKSVTKAADALSISQPAVTIQIRNLEKETGLKLIKTEGRGINLTKEGEFLVKRAESLFNMEQDIENKLIQLKDGELQELHISSTSLPANYLLPTWLAKFKLAYPSVKINLSSGNSYQVVDQLLHYKSDIAFVVKEEWHHPTIQLHHLMDIEFWFIVPTGHKYDGQEVSLHDLMDEPFLVREEGSSTREVLFSLCNLHNVPVPNIGIQFHGLNESIRSVLAGYGAMLAPSLAVKDHIHRNELGKVLVKDIEIKRPVYLCTRKEDAHTIHLSRLIDLINGFTKDDFY
ncbi:LysR family transcriptional regulator [Shouchella clausii]|uniref:LysR family transcriptional regulator n=1 Tax=Shouchella TaxID=2893057 RepID=UPI0004E68FFD|nr:MULTISPECIES: LysR family transcriptional regulator [Shouchella]ALA53493.1 Transcriptional regulator, LysR family [Shouchella clausii]MBU3229919.1 LysR family transcriptional regulator [Shouchella clausii]MBU3263997.1 LysR family transcriptional regulator [Shouchella clausii]MBU3506820.1 LysR family transcriptional regulator [Shouchella clausii]MBU3535185.1 LysR family transcriptional regulator [Shouchella clausii]